MYNYNVKSFFSFFLKNGNVRKIIKNQPYAYLIGLYKATWDLKITKVLSEDVHLRGIDDNTMSKRTQFLWPYKMDKTTFSI